MSDIIVVQEESAEVVVVTEPTQTLHLVQDGGVGAVDHDATLSFLLDNGGLPIPPGIKGDLRVDFACEILGASVFADQIGSIVIDLWKSSYAGYPPTDSGSITGTSPLTIANSIKTEDTTLDGWTTDLEPGDILRVNVDSSAAISRVTLAIHVRRAEAL